MIKIISTSTTAPIWMTKNEKTCPLCRRTGILPGGPGISRFALVLDYPEEEGKGTSSGGAIGMPTTFLEVLGLELRKFMFDVSHFQLMYAYGYGLKDYGLMECACNEWWRTELFLQLGNNTHAILFGSGATLQVLKTNAGEILGTWQHNSLLDTEFMVAPSPASIFHGGIGEFRLALGKFFKKVGKDVPF